MRYFGESPKTTPPSVFFPVFVRFIRSYKEAEQENEARKKQEEVMREKQLAQEAKKLDAKVGGTESRGLEKTGQRIRRGWSERKGRRDGKLEPRPPRGPGAGIQWDGERGFGRGFPGEALG